MVVKKYENIVEDFKCIQNVEFKYPYFEYINNKQYIQIECKEHGLFTQQIRVHNRGFGCKKCSSKIKSLNKIKNIQDVIIGINKIHNGKYEYPNILKEYVNNTSIISILCKKHGIFKQTLNSHMSKRGCKKCALEYTSHINKLKFSEILIKSKIRHSNLYEYFKYEDIESNKNKIGVICKKHGDFIQQINNHMNGHGCPKCRKRGISKPEIEVENFIKSLKYIVKSNNRSMIKPYELDIWIPSLNKAIEFNGKYWHYDQSNTRCKPRGYHAMKSNLCREKGIRLLHLREDLWIRDKEKMKSIIIKFLKNGYKLGKLPI